MPQIPESASHVMRVVYKSYKLTAGLEAQIGNEGEGPDQIGI